jgi:poly-gamma-glutamate biosynthesis protein PgsC/CapC
MLDNIIVLGVIASIIFYEWTEISPGGVIVPGYIALFFNNPMRIISTILISLLTYGAVKMLSNYTILYGRRKFSIFIIISFLLRFFINQFLEFTNLPVSTALIIGYLVPALIAQDIDRQGAVKTISAMFSVAFLLKLTMMIYGA